MAEDWTPKDNWSPNNHNHDSKYSKLDHLHDDRYSQTSHNHDSVYSKLGHVHEYADKNHNHDTVYSKLSHTHDDKYSKLGHTHDERYYTESEVNTLVTSLLKYPDYADEDILDEGTTTYTAKQDGWIFAYARREAKYWHVCINGKRVWATGGSSYDSGSCFLPIKSGDVVAIYAGNGTDDEAETAYDGALLKFYPNR